MKKTYLSMALVLITACTAFAEPDSKLSSQEKAFIRVNELFGGPAAMGQGFGKIPHPAISNKYKGKELYSFDSGFKFVCPEAGDPGCNVAFDYRDYKDREIVTIKSTAGEFRSLKWVFKRGKS